jgi:hypothetical protein
MILRLFVRFRAMRFWLFYGGNLLFYYLPDGLKFFQSEEGEWLFVIMFVSFSPSYDPLGVIFSYFLSMYGILSAGARM